MPQAVDELVRALNQMGRSERRKTIVGGVVLGALGTLGIAFTTQAGFVASIVPAAAGGCLIAAFVSMVGVAIHHTQWDKHPAMVLLRERPETVSAVELTRLMRSSGHAKTRFALAVPRGVVRFDVTPPLEDYVSQALRQLCPGAVAPPAEPPKS
jgi:hypothetical protein